MSLLAVGDWDARQSGSGKGVEEREE